MHIHTAQCFGKNFEQHQIVNKVLSQIAQEKAKSLERIKRLLLIERNNAVIRRFWQLLDAQLPQHSFQYVGCCPVCGFFELRDTLPPNSPEPFEELVEHHPLFEPCLYIDPYIPP
jgi:hypothetical protein